MENEMRGVPESDSFGKVRANPWILATVALAIVIVVLLIVKPGATTGKVVSEDAVSESLLSFVKAQGGGEATVVSSEKNGSFYQITVNYQNQTFPVYVTLDGKYLVPSLISLSEKPAAADTADKPAAASDSEPAAPAPEMEKSAKPKVEVFVMSMCPYGTQIEKGVIPVAELLGDKIDFSIKFVSYAMHGKTEVDENTRQYCIQKEQPSKFFKYMNCYLKEGKSEDCLTSEGVDKTKLETCIKATDEKFNITANFDNKDSWLSGRYPMFNINKVECDKYGVQGSPTLVINGVQASSARDSASLLKAVCAAFTTAPEECSETLSSTAPSPGFGTAAASSGSAGGCGG